MHVSKMEGSWNETDSDFKQKFSSSTDLFDNQMMPKEKITTANDIDLQIALTVIINCYFKESETTSLSNTLSLEIR